MIEFEPLQVLEMIEFKPLQVIRDDGKKRFMTAVVVLPVSRIGIPRRTGTYFSLPGVSRSFLTLFVRQNGELPLVAENCNIAGMHTRGGLSNVLIGLSIV